MVRFRIAWFQIAATAAWIVVLSGGTAVEASFARHDDQVASQVLNDGSAPFHIAFLDPNELISDEEIERETQDIDQHGCNGANALPSREGAFERLRPHGDREWSSAASLGFSARGPPRG